MKNVKRSRKHIFLKPFKKKTDGKIITTNHNGARILPVKVRGCADRTGHGARKKRKKMELFRIIGIAIVTALTVIILKNVKPELAFAAMLAGVIVLLVAALDMMKETFSVFDELVALTGIDNAVVKILLKIIGVGYLTEFSADLLNDFGSASLASKVELCGKITILALSLPILRSLLALITDFLSLL